MSNARDKANIPSLNFSSTGIDDNATSTAITIDSSERVGIGTSSPSNSLHVNSGSVDRVVYFESTDNNANIALKDSNGGALLGTGDTGQLKFFTGYDASFSGGSEVMRIDSSGNVGIGTTSPISDARLTVSSDNSESYIFFERSGSTRFDSAIGMQSSSIVFKGGVNSSTVSGLNEFMRIDDSGRVGIGTTSTNTQLNVVGTGVNGINLGQQSDNSANSSRLFFNNSTNIWTTYSTAGSFKIASGASIGNTSGTDRLVIDSSGNVGLGISNPTSPLHIKNASNPKFHVITASSTASYNAGFLVSAGNSASASTRYVTLALDADGGDGSGSDNFTIKKIGGSPGNVELTQESSANILFKTADTERMRIDSSGHILVGSSSSAGGTNGSALQVKGDTGSTDYNIGLMNSINQLAGRFHLASSGSNSIAIGADPDDLASSSTLTFEVDGSEGMRIDSGLNVLIGTTSFSSGSKGKQFENNANAIALRSGSATTATTFHNEFHNPNGAVGSIRTAGTSTSYVTSSDYRLKENVSYDFDATTRLKQLKPARFNFIADANTTLDGFLAHEVQDIVPEAISGEKDAVNEDGSINPQGIDQSKLVPLLVKTIQELEARITALETNQP